MLNTRKKCIVLSCDAICPNKTYSECVSRKEHAKSDNYILQDEDNSDKWDYVKIDTFKA